jgi:hypothetical protein
MVSQIHIEFFVVRNLNVETKNMEWGVGEIGGI